MEYRGHAKEGLEPDSAWDEMGEKTPGTWSKSEAFELWESLFKRPFGLGDMAQSSVSVTEALPPGAGQRPKNQGKGQWRKTPTVDLYPPNTCAHTCSHTPTHKHTRAHIHTYIPTYTLNK